ncbi:MAG: thioesterase family protein [Glaciecola sp.]
MNDATAINQVNLRIRVRYGECDAQHVVFNARYADYADLGATEYIRALVGSHQALLEQGFDNQVVSLHIDWVASARFDDVLELQVFASHIGNTSFALTTNCYVVKNTELHKVATVVTTYVMVDAKTFEKRQIPNSLREQFSRAFLVEVDQAG